MRYRLRTLLIVLAVGPVLGAWGYWEHCKWQERERQRLREQEWGEVFELIQADPSSQAVSPPP